MKILQIFFAILLIECGTIFYGSCQQIFSQIVNPLNEFSGLLGNQASKVASQIFPNEPNNPGRVVANYAGEPEAEMSVPQLIRHWGYPVETYQATTKDGYILTLHRIPYGRHQSSGAIGKPIVFLQHGLLCTSSVWIMNLPHQSPGFMFADEGFDVWMGNVRGNTYSKKHRKPDIRQSEYWHFTWDEHAKYDLEAMIDQVLSITGQKQLYYLGHSQGTLTMFSKLATDDGLNDKIKKFFAVAPVGTVAHVKGLFRYLGENSYQQLSLFTMLFGDQEFLPNTIISRWLTELICGLASSNPMCENFLFLVSGPDSRQLNKTRIGIYLAHNPAGTSTRNILHFTQMVKHRKHLAFDYGRKENMIRYGRPTPLAYNISRIRVPMYLYYSDADWLATSSDIQEYLLPNLNKLWLREAKNLNDFNHNDFLWGLRAPTEVYRPIIDIILQDLPATTTVKGPKTTSTTEPPSFFQEPDGDVEDSDLLRKIRNIHLSRNITDDDYNLLKNPISQ
uniref:Partial AB-hydrolase lipase domain-containing protein n=1 Tax=Acrobeloides nanus TaxID=290746 RepID=A0A914CBE6_9BILA